METDESNILLAVELKRQAAKLQELAEKAESLANRAPEENSKGTNYSPSALRARPSVPYQNTFRARIRQKGQVTIPSKVRKALDLDEGDSLIGVYDTNSGELRFIEDVSVNPGKAWFWQDRWQEMLHQSVSDLIDGRTSTVDSLSDATDT